MTTKLRSPSPRKRPRSCPTADYGFPEAIFLRPAKSIALTFDRVLSRRRSSRQFGGRLPTSRLAPLLWFSAKNRHMNAPSDRPDWRSRPYPSAGGCHELDLLVLNVADHEDAAFIYDGAHHALGMLPGVTKRHIKAFLDELSETMPVRRATVLWFIADLRKLAARYADAESLLWRDSGALGATLSLSAAALGYASCLVGIHAPATIRRILGRPWLAGVGGIVVGFPVRHTW